MDRSVRRSSSDSWQHRRTTLHGSPASSAPSWPTDSLSGWPTRDGRSGKVGATWRHDGGADALLDDLAQRRVDDGWDVAICLTDLPLHTDRVPLVAQSSAQRRAAFVSLPALGCVRLIDTPVLEQILRRPTHATDHLTLAWIISSLATVGGANGSGLEDEETVRAAAYGYHPEPGGWRDQADR